MVGAGDDAERSFAALAIACVRWWRPAAPGFAALAIACVRWWRPAAFRPKHKLAVLVVCAIPLAEPVRLARTPEYGGCTSWVQLPLTPQLAEPVHDEAALAEVAARVREAVG